MKAQHVTEDVIVRAAKQGFILSYTNDAWVCEGCGCLVAIMEIARHVDACTIPRKEL